MSIKHEDYYSTTDLSLASALSLFIPIELIDKSNPHKAEFLFIREKGLDKLIENYWSNKLQVSPLAFFQQLKINKSRLYAK